MFFVNVIYISSPKEKKISKIVALRLLWWMFMTKKWEKMAFLKLLLFFLTKERKWFELFVKVEKEKLIN